MNRQVYESERYSDSGVFETISGPLRRSDARCFLANTLEPAISASPAASGGPRMMLAVYCICAAALQPFSDAWRTLPAARSSLAWRSSWPRATWYVLDVMSVLDRYVV